MATKTTSTRDLILSLLKKRNQLTVSAIAVVLDITEMAVRRHLNTLERDGIIETTLLRQAMGRPTNVYQLSNEGQEMFPRNYGMLTVELLKDLVEMDGVEKVQKLFQKRMERQKERYEKKMVIQQFDDKVYELARLQSEEGYMAEVTEEEDGSFTFKEYNCPIAEVARQFPFICESELQLFKEVLQTENIECQMCMASGQESHCSYKIYKTDQSEAGT
ncbi:iron-sulfur cluster biosynthesis transcriptional regulator SufR [Evansella vedderi]|uniref:Iron-sulfur cluster biosynthesis transcriptional regulator SufR n=1 Tax=Evansella vedderi TaxID=38282 RepID=A0ABU0A3Q2_9BACI|nr:metalloregulator ArsR/SmtB family transcription factor [Evansella vedderi]MDQ0257637.1 iron-sulfur cluster biosynthesis transcriptional regulator SufR [Evansella vedderi]